MRNSVPQQRKASVSHKHRLVRDQTEALTYTFPTQSVLVGVWLTRQTAPVTGESPQ
jgi:hypothetical protein